MISSPFWNIMIQNGDEIICTVTTTDSYTGTATLSETVTFGQESIRG